MGSGVYLGTCSSKPPNARLLHLTCKKGGSAQSGVPPWCGANRVGLAGKLQQNGAAVSPAATIPNTSSEGGTVGCQEPDSQCRTCCWPPSRTCLLFLGEEAQVNEKPEGRRVSRKREK